ncbi:formylglycine-generating enzyme family protein [Actinoplanes sp. NPDC051851]|uniref:formylglycine-generating enzyme family protein n=1 Tax=Actinoplanes sp. NPDC051851 TaxID=3154753 RepID=UPI003444A26C
MQETGACCSTRRQRPGTASAGTAVPAGAGSHRIEQCPIPAGAFAMGDGHGDGRLQDGEQPVHRVELDAFTIDATTVTNEDFAAFAAGTGYRTDAETFGSSAVFHRVVAAEHTDVLGRDARAPWWWDVRGADWRHPEGPLSDIDGRNDHPVVHVSWNDAQAYCRWAGRALPTEAQWERAARGGLTAARYPWGDEAPGSGGAWRANIWQGRFPDHNTAEDGWVTTAPVRTYRPNGLGLWQSVGNVWEWCADSHDPRAYARRAPGPVANPVCTAETGARVLRGGSYLCHDSYCNRYRNAARSANTADSSMANAGFRTVAAG